MRKGTHVAQLLPGVIRAAVALDRSLDVRRAMPLIARQAVFEREEGSADGSAGPAMHGAAAYETRIDRDDVQVRPKV